MRILVTDGMDKTAMAQLREAGHEVVEQFYAPEELGAALREFDAVVVRSKTKVRANHIDEAKGGKLKLIIRGGVGVDNIDVKYAEANGITVKNTPKASSQSVAELAMGHMFSCARYLSIAGHTMREDKWEKKAYGKGIELRGKTLGVIGLGAIGVLVANAAVALGMNVVGYDPMISVEHAWKLSQRVKHENSLDELFAACDFITVHVPMNDKTRGMIGRRALSLCKKGVRILNYARGGLVDEAALLEALADGRVAAYVTDFPSDALLGAKGVICTPHLGASTPESEENCAVMAAAQMRDFLESGIIHNSVNLPAVDVAPVSKPRLFCIHENVPNVLGSITSAVAGFGLNISDLVNRSRGNIAVSVVDLDDVPKEKQSALIEAVEKLAGMKRVRLLGV